MMTVTGDRETVSAISFLSDFPLTLCSYTLPAFQFPVNVTNR